MSTQFAAHDDKKVTLSLNDAISHMFMVLSEKERDVITKRFSLDNKPRQTLESIGKKFSVTRERVRQIENIALNKLKRTVQSTGLKEINDIAVEILMQIGGVVLETVLVSEVLKRIENPSKIDGHIIRLSLCIDDRMKKQEKTNQYNVFWYISTIQFETIKATVDTAIKLLKQKGDVLPEDNMVARIINKLAPLYDGLTPTFVESSLTVDKRLKRADGGWGLMSWRHVNPKSIRDKAYIVFKKEKRPLHFVELANKIIEYKFDSKVVTTQAVHNELIRYDQFVLIGRGLYALKEWGYESGTVADVISAILEKNEEPMTKKQIIDEVLLQRKIKVGTISLNLQNNPKFVRVGRAVYDLRERA